MANPYSATLRSAADDGTNTYLFIEISDGTRTMPVFQFVVPTGTTAAAVRTLLQGLATNQPTVAAGLQTLMNSAVAGL
jgi:hypothetical protein